MHLLNLQKRKLYVVVLPCRINIFFGCGSSLATEGSLAYFDQLTARQTTSFSSCLFQQTKNTKNNTLFSLDHLLPRSWLFLPLLLLLFLCSCSSDYSCYHVYDFNGNRA